MNSIGLSFQGFGPGQYALGLSMLLFLEEWLREDGEEVVSTSLRESVAYRMGQRTRVMSYT